MNTLRQTCAAAILSLALAVSAFAGQIDSPGAPAPQPQPPGETNAPPSDLTTTMILTIINLIR